MKRSNKNRRKKRRKILRKSLQAALDYSNCLDPSKRDFFHFPYFYLGNSRCETELSRIIRNLWENKIIDNMQHCKMAEIWNLLHDQSYLISKYFSNLYHTWSQSFNSNVHQFCNAKSSCFFCVKQPWNGSNFSCIFFFILDWNLNRILSLLKYISSL